MDNFDPLEMSEQSLWTRTESTAEVLSLLYVRKKCQTILEQYLKYQLSKLKFCSKYKQFWTTTAWRNVFKVGWDPPPPPIPKVKFIYSEKTTKFCKTYTLFLSYVVPVKSKLEISQNFVAFSEYMNFNIFSTNAFTNKRKTNYDIKVWFL